MTLSQDFVLMQFLLERTDTITPAEKEKIRENLKMYDPLWEENPRVQEIRAKSRLEGKREGEVRMAQRILINITKARFPNLAELAQEKLTQINQPDVLDLLAAQIASAPGEQYVHWLLSMLQV